MEKLASGAEPSSCMNRIDVSIRNRPPAPHRPMPPMTEFESGETASPETSLFQVLSQGKRSAGPPVGPPPPPQVFADDGGGGTGAEGGLDIESGAASPEGWAAAASMPSWAPTLATWAGAGGARLGAVVLASSRALDVGSGAPC